MSLRWSDRICAALAPGRVSTAVWPRGWSSGPAERASLPCTQPTDGPRWQPAVDSLRQWLEERPARQARLHLVLSNRFVRYAVMPWRDGILRAEEREAQARHLLCETYGEGAARWHLRLADAGYGRPALVCAVDHALVDALQQLAAERRLHLAAVQPLLMLAFNRFRRDLGDESCLMVLEPGALCCAVVRAGCWQAVQVGHVGPQGWNEALVERQIAVHGLPADMPVFLFDASGAAQPQREGDAYRSLRTRPAAKADLALSLFAQHA